MPHSAFASAAWLRALTLRERLVNLPPFPEIKDSSAQQEAERRLQKWRDQEPFKSGTIPWEKRLEAEGVTEAQLRYVLVETPEALQQRLGGYVPPWLDTLREAFSQPVSSEPFPVPPPLDKMAVVGFMEAVRPLIEWGRARVKAHVRELARQHTSLLFDPETVEKLLFAALPRRLLERINRTMVLEMNVARLQGRLQGETGDARFQSFVQQLRDPQVSLALFQEYALLARLCTVTVEQWCNTSREFISRLAEDGQALRETLLPPEPGLLESVSGEAGDQHHHGHTVQLLQFSSGAKVVYKPRSFGVDQHFQEFLAWINAREQLPAFRLMRLLPREGYGWSEFVEPHPCESEDAVKRFYVRLGAKLALFHHMGGMDMHFENLIADGEQPVIVDLETLFHPQLSDRMAYLTEDEQIFIEVIDHSLTRIAMLPLVTWSREDHEGVDIGGMGSPEGKLSPRKMLHWEEQGQDTMHHGRARVVMKGAKNLPVLHGEVMTHHHFQDALCDGYRRMCRLLMSERDAVLAPDGPLRRFAGDEIRVLLRSTQIYYVILQEGYHPDLVRDALERDRYFDGLWPGMKRRPFLMGVAREEREALHRGDIPRYSSRPESRDLWSGPNECLPGFLWGVGLESSEARIRELNEATVERDVWWIRASLLAALTEVPLEQTRKPAGPASGKPLERTRLLSAATAVGDRILTLGISRGGALCWMGSHQSDQNRWPFGPMTLDLYGGMPGITLFLAQLGRESGEERFIQAARQASAVLRRVAGWGRTRMQVLGGFEGWGGVVYTLTSLGALWDEPALFAEAEAIVEALPPHIQEDRNLDVIGGAAGCIGGLLALHRVAGSARALEAAVRCGEHLLEHRQPQPQGGVGWMTKIPSAQPLSGFSHGASGIAWALLELASASGQERFRDVALQALTYERTLLDAGARNWRDPRTSAAAGGFMCAWCYGAPGIGLARARALRHLDEPSLREDLRVAVRTTLAQGFGNNDSLCHGDLGNLELLVQAQALGELPDGLDTTLWGILADVTSRAEQRAWRCAVPMEVDTPGLMIGLAGIGWGLLRFAAPQRIPNILLLEAPGAKGGAIR